MSFLSIAIISVGAWLLINGILHDIAVLSSVQGRIYNRDLLRLLMDGHILMTCGIVLLLSFQGIRQDQPWAFFIAMTVCTSILVYCAMIFPFLKSFFTIFLNAGLLILLLIHFLKR